jgi:hypothetical protein
MNKNNLSLKSLKAELEQLKIKRTTKRSSVSKPKGDVHKASVAHDIKNSYIQNLHMRSSMFYLWLVTGILGYAQNNSLYF